MGKIKNWSPQNESSHSGWSHDETDLQIRVVQVSETEFELPDEFTQFNKWATGIFTNPDDGQMRQLLGTTTTVSEGRSVGFRYINENTGGRHWCLPEMELRRARMRRASVDVSSSESNRSTNNNTTTDRSNLVTEEMEWVGSDECPSCDSSGQFTVASRPEIIAMYGPETAKEYFTAEDSTHACLNCGFLWFGVADHVDTSQLWNVRMASDGKRIEKLPQPDEEAA